MRVNLDPAAKAAGYHMFGSARELLNDLIGSFCREYQVGDLDAYKYLLNRDTVHRLVSLMKDRGINADHYDMEGIASWGFVIADDDPILVEYKLKQEE